MSAADDITNGIAEAVAQVREMLAPIDEATMGYRRQLEESGWSPAVAEQMALAFHALMLTQVAAAAGQS